MWTILFRHQCDNITWSDWNQLMVWIINRLMVGDVCHACVAGSLAADGNSHNKAVSAVQHAWTKRACIRISWCHRWINTSGPNKTSSFGLAFWWVSHRKNNDMHYDPGLWGQFSIVHHFQVTWLAAIVWIHAGSDTVSRIPQSQTSASAVNERLTDKMADSKYARFNENRDYQVRKQMMRRTNLPVVPICCWEWILVFVISHTVSDFMNRASLILTAAVRCQLSLGLTH